MSNQDYLFGVLSAKFSNLLTDKQYQELSKIPKTEMTEYLYFLNVLDKKYDDFELFAEGFEQELKEEISSYIGISHPIYQYFFAQGSPKSHQYNENYPYLVKLLSVNVIDQVHLIRNLILMFRLSFQNKNSELLKKNILTQSLSSTDALTTVYLGGKNTIKTFSNDLLQIKITNDMDIIKIEHTLKKKLNTYVKTLSYSDNFNDIIFFYIWTKYIELEKIKSIYYLGMSGDLYDIN